jgi:mRNA interferase MazF
MQRGDVWWAELPSPIGRRPVLLLSRDLAYNIRTSIIVALVTRTIRNIPVEVPLGKEDSMTSRCVVNLDEILTIPKSRIVERITHLSPAKLAAVNKAIVFALDLEI